MTFGESILYLVIAMACGALGQALAGYSLGGLVITTFLGLAGAVVGEAIARAIGAPEVFVVHVGDKTILFVWSVLGAALLTLLVSLARRHGRRARANAGRKP